MGEIRHKKLFLLDMDGTLYLGNSLFPETRGFLENIKKCGGKYIFLTNNTSNDVGRYVEKLASMGIEATKQDIITPTQVVANFLLEKHGKNKIYAFGTVAFREELTAAGLSITDKLDDGIVCLVMGFDTELTFKKLDDACILLGRGVDYIAANPDLVCPTEYGYVPDCGSVSVMLKNATGREPKFFGKPNPEMVYQALERTGTEKEDAIIVGDRLYTDIACGINAGIDTALVLSGETKKEDLANSPYTPTYVFENVGVMMNQVSGKVGKFDYN